MAWMGYFFTFLNYAFYCVSRFLKKKHQMLALDLLAKIACVIGLFFMGSLSGAYSMAVTFFYLILANIKERKEKRWLLVYCCAQIMLIVVMVVSFAGIPSLLIFVSSSIALLSVWWLPPQKMRITGLIANGFTLAYHLSIQNWAGLFELAVIASNALSYLKYNTMPRR